jgi:hypothetical protein
VQRLREKCEQARERWKNESSEMILKKKGREEMLKKYNEIYVEFKQKSGTRRKSEQQGIDYTFIYNDSKQKIERIKLELKDCEEDIEKNKKEIEVLNILAEIQRLKSDCRTREGELTQIVNHIMMVE